MPPSRNSEKPSELFRAVAALKLQVPLAAEVFRDVARTRRRNSNLFEENLLLGIGETDDEFERKLNSTTSIETNVRLTNSTDSESISVEKSLREIRASGLKRASTDLQIILTALTTVLQLDSLDSYDGSVDTD